MAYQVVLESSKLKFGTTLSAAKNGEDKITPKILSKILFFIEPVIIFPL